VFNVLISSITEYPGSLVACLRVPMKMRYDYCAYADSLIVFFTPHLSLFSMSAVDCLCTLVYC